MRKFIFTNTLALGDIVMLTAAVRDLHRNYPGTFVTDVRTPFRELWLNNPFITPLDEYDPGVKVVPISYPLIRASNDTPSHALHGFADYLGRYLGVPLQLTEFRGDIHLSRREQAAPSPVRDRAGRSIPFWIIAAGGKADCTIKWWDARRYQAVVHHFRGRIQFVQVGAAEHFHPRLEGVIDLRGRTTVRELVRLMHHAQGVVCGVTSLMHLAAAVPTRGRLNRVRPCVVVAGGREPAHWEAYPGHQFLHTIGALPCCLAGGCWRARTVPLGDGESFDAPEQLCLNVRRSLPACMDLISADEVVHRVETYFEGGATRYLTPVERRASVRAVQPAAANPRENGPLTFFNARARAEQFIAALPPAPGPWAGRGIVICAGGVQLFTNAWVCVRMLRRLGCRLPIQLWHLGRGEMDARMKALLAPLGVACVDAWRVAARRGGVRPASGFALKPFALLHSPFREALLLDADNVPVANPEYLFETPEFRRTGAIFWPDFHRLAPDRPIWKLCGVPYRDEPEIESGQIVVDKARCWAPLRLALWYNEHAGFFYRHVHGDKETFHLAFRKLNRPYAMPARPIHPLHGTMCQHDFRGRRLFQHRNGDKWNLFLHNRRARGFLFEKECREDVRQLGHEWDGRARSYQPSAPSSVVAVRTPLQIHLCMISCPEREATRRATLRDLAQTDWGDAPVHVQMDPGRFAHRVDNITHTAWLGLQASLRHAADYVLFLEDDVRFNRHLRHNLERWAPVREHTLTFGGLCRITAHALAYDVPRQLIVAYPRSVAGSQAFLFSRATVTFILEHWKEEPTPFDLRAPRLAARLGQPIVFHAPSLVQHVGRRSTWGADFRDAPDFDRNWKASG